MKFPSLPSSAATFFAASTFLMVACSDSSTPSDATTDAPTNAHTCEARSQAFTEFVQAHRDCTVSSDCVVIGDCGPNADFTSVRVDAAGQARTLQQARCASAYDGPVYNPVCVQNVCSLQMRTDTCCGCLAVDAGAGDGG
jgi:hypothetical protein